MKRKDVTPAGVGSKNYTVYVYKVVRVIVPVRATSPEEAITRAGDAYEWERLFEGIRGADTHYTGVCAGVEVVLDDDLSFQPGSEKRK